MFQVVRRCLKMTSMRLSWQRSSATALGWKCLILDSDQDQCRRPLPQLPTCPELLVDPLPTSLTPKEGSHGFRPSFVVSGLII